MGLLSQFKVGLKELDGRDMHDTQDEFFLSIMRIMHILLII